jgi:hypothetical protein
MTCSPICSPDTDGYEEGWIGLCPNCDSIRWFNGNPNRLYSVPGLQHGLLPLVEVKSKDDSLIDDLRKPKAMRMVFAASYKRIKSQRKKSHIETFLGLTSPPKGKTWKARFDELQKIVNIFGLQFSSLLPNENITESTPLLLHWNSKDPYNSFVESIAANEPKSTSSPCKDPLWLNGSFQFDIEQISNHLEGGFKDTQEAAIKNILTTQGSLQIIALPTGFGKTRIIQATSSILYKNELGPSLMISPIIALRDDQREAFQREFDGNPQMPDEYKLNSRFITAADTDIINIQDELMGGEIGLLCCSPEQLMTPGWNQSWMEVFRKMEKPFSTLIIDEAHLVGDWGSSFRSHFLLLGQLMKRLVELNPGLRVILQSATLTKNEKKELKSLFEGPEVLQEIAEFDVRKDLHFNVILEKPVLAEKNRRTIEYEKWTKKITTFYENAPDLWQQPFDLGCDSGRSPLLIYSAIKIDAENRILPTLKSSGLLKNVKSFTGDTNPAEKDNMRKSFKLNQFDAMVATSAFGMGIDKPDLWTIGYLGLPFTLKGLYQGFGRSARNSNWDLRTENLPYRNGNCIAVLPDVDVNRARPWRPELRLGLAAERLWNLIVNGTTLSKKGYMVLPILKDLEVNEWLQEGKSIDSFLQNSGTCELEDEEIDLSGVNLENQYDLAKIKRDRGISQAKQSNLGYRMWAIACLQRSGAVSLMGFYPPVLAVDQMSGEKKHLVSILEQNGHEGVTQVLRNLNRSLRTPEPQPRLAVIRINKPFTSWASFLGHIKEGHEILEKRHKMGNKELSEFLSRMKKKSCIRKSFGPAIGMDYKDVDDCSTALKKWKSEAQLSQMPPVPCAHCVVSMDFSQIDSLGLWLTNDSLEKLNSPYRNDVYDDFSYGDDDEDSYGVPIGKAQFDEENKAIFQTITDPIIIPKIVCYDQDGMVIELKCAISEHGLEVINERNDYAVILSQQGETFYLRLVSRNLYRDQEC